MDLESGSLHLVMNRQRGLFTTQDALAAGYSGTEIRRRVRSGRWVRVRRAVMTTREHAEQHASAAEIHSRTATSAVLVVGRPSALSHESAAYELGVDVAGTPDLVVPSITVPPLSLSRASGVHVYRNTAHRGHVWPREPADITSPARTVVDLARLRPFADAVVAADSALRQGLVVPEQLLLTVADCEGWPGWRRAGAVVEFADGRAQSPLESYARVMCLEQGLPPPEPQMRVVVRGKVYYGDLGWREHRTIAEIDGRVKYGDEALYGRGVDEVLYEEKLRHDAIEESGVAVVRLSAPDIHRRARASADRIRAGFARSGRWVA